MVTILLNSYYVNMNLDIFLNSRKKDVARYILFPLNKIISILFTLPIQKVLNRNMIHNPIDSLI